MESKAWYASRTVWLNVAYGIGAIASVVGASGFQPDQRTVETVSLVVAVLNVLLRFRTNQGIQ